jgi:hypothetical protein
MVCQYEMQEVIGSLSMHGQDVVIAVCAFQAAGQHDGRNLATVPLIAPDQEKLDIQSLCVMLPFSASVFILARKSLLSGRELAL